MSTVYITIDAVVSAPGGLIISGAAPIVAKTVALTGRALGEMAGEASIGEVTDLQLTQGNLFVRARIAAGRAGLKVRERVLNTIAVIFTRVRDEVRVERVSLVDRPGALEKRAGGLPGASLTFAKGLTMQRIELGRELRLDSAPPDLAKRAEMASRDEEAVAMIKRALKSGPKYAGDVAVKSWLI